MTTGRHVVRDLFCVCCKSLLGWKYDIAYEQPEKYKEGKIILERLGLIDLDADINNNINNNNGVPWRHITSLRAFRALLEDDLSPGTSSPDDYTQSMEGPDGREMAVYQNRAPGEPPGWNSSARGEINPSGQQRHSPSEIILDAA